jgi:hypothetical protein
MATITIEGDHVKIRLSGWQAVFALKREIDVALNNVVSAEAGTLTSKRPDGIRLPGTYLPGVITSGSYWWKDRGWSFWSVRHEERALDIRLRDEHYNRVVVEVADSYGTASMIAEAIHRNRSGTRCWV